MKNLRIEFKEHAQGHSQDVAEPGTPQVCLMPTHLLLLVPTTVPSAGAGNPLTTSTSHIILYLLPLYTKLPEDRGHIVCLGNSPA